jgi:hypothetical protein
MGIIIIRLLIFVALVTIAVLGAKAAWAALNEDKLNKSNQKLHDAKEGLATLKEEDENLREEFKVAKEAKKVSENIEATEAKIDKL